MSAGAQKGEVSAGVKFKAIGHDPLTSVKPDKLLVLRFITPLSKDRIAEMVRLNRTLSPLRIPVDLLVVSQEMFDYWAETPGNVYYRANKEGKVIYEAA